MHDYISRSMRSLLSFASLSWMTNNIASQFSHVFTGCIAGQSSCWTQRVWNLIYFAENLHFRVRINWNDEVFFHFLFLMSKRKSWWTLTSSTFIPLVYSVWHGHQEMKSFSLEIIWDKNLNRKRKHNSLPSCLLITSLPSVLVVNTSVTVSCRTHSNSILFENN